MKLPAVPVPAMESTRVLIVDDHPLVREAIKRACEDRPALQVVGESADGREAVDRALALRPDVLVVDLGLPGLDGLEVTRRVRKEAPSVRVLLISDRSDRGTVLEAIRAGAAGLVEKTQSVRDIAVAVEQVAEGARAFSEHHQRTAQQELGRIVRRSRRVARVLSLLTRREREVLALLLAGLSTKQIAFRLGVSARTIESHIGSLYRKLGVHTRLQVVNWAAGLSLPDLRGIEPEIDAG